MPSIVVPQGYSYVLAAAFSSLPLTLWQGFCVGSSRAKAGIPYPRAYATEAEATSNPAAQVFNCTQRAHQNTLETLPHVLLGTLVTGLKYPRFAAGTGAVWCVGRILYTIGYRTGVSENRHKYSTMPHIALLVLTAATGVTVFQFVKEGL